MHARASASVRTSLLSFPVQPTSPSRLQQSGAERQQLDGPLPCMRGRLPCLDCSIEALKGSN